MDADEFHRVCNAAEGYIELGLLEDAVELLEKLPPKLKITKEVIILHTTILVKSGELLKASYLTENLWFADPDNVELMLEVARLRYDAGEFAEALKWLQSVVTKCPKSADYHILKAKCFAALNDLEECLASLTEAHRLEPQRRLSSSIDPAFEAVYGPGDPSASV